MARIVYSGLVTEIRGSIGGTTFQSNAYGFSVKNKANMVRPNSVKQNQSKVIMSKSVKGWQTITDAQRALWETFATNFPQYAKKNPSAQLSGFAAFVKFHNFVFLGTGIGEPYSVTPVTSMPATDTVTWSVVVAGGVMTLGYNWAGSTGDWLVNVFVSRKVLGSQQFVGSRPRFMAQIINDDGSTVITTAFTSAFGGLPSVGDTVIVSYVMGNTGGGRVLARVDTRVVVTAS